MICANCESTGFTCGGCGVNLEPEDAYTAAEVKVLTETATRVAYALGRKDAGEEIAAALKRRRERTRDEGQRGWALLTEAWVIALDNASQPSQAASDATSGVPRHSEVSEAARSPQEPCGHPTCPCAEGTTHD